MKKRLMFAAIIVLACICLAGCKNSKRLKDGFYTAEMSEFEYGWKEYLCVQIKSGKIVSAEFNAKNESGFIKAWDNSYMDNMNSIQGTYPNKYTREYVSQLLEGQADTNVDAVTGATSSGHHFEKLVMAVLEQAGTGASETAIVTAE